MRKIPYGRQNIDADDIDAVVSVLKSDFLTQGPIVNQFEEKFARYVGANFAVAVNNATAALHLSALALGLKKGDRVITTPITFAATANCIRYVGAEVWFADINPDTYLLDINSVIELINSKPKGFFKGIIPVDFAGLPVNMEAFRKLANSHNLWIIEDACQAIGLKIQKKYSGTVGDLGVYSFDSTKCMTTINGGLLICNNKTYLKQFKRMKNYLDSSLENSFSSIQAKLGISQLNRYDQFVRKRKLIYSKFYKEFSNINSIKIKKIKKNYLFRFTFKTKIPFKTLEKKFKNEGIIIKKGVDKVLHVRNKKNDTKYKKTVSTFNETVSIPFYPSLSNTEVKKIINSTKKIFNDFNN